MAKHPAPPPVLREDILMMPVEISVSKKFERTFVQSYLHYLHGLRSFGKTVLVLIFVMAFTGELQFFGTSSSSPKEIYVHKYISSKRTSSQILLPCLAKPRERAPSKMLLNAS